MEYQVTADELQQIVANIETPLAADSGQGYHRVVKYHVGEDRYRVYDHHELVLTTPSVEDAAAAFNSIRPRAVSGGAR